MPPPARGTPIADSHAAIATVSSLWVLADRAGGCLAYLGGSVALTELPRFFLGGKGELNVTKLFRALLGRTGYGGDPVGSGETVVDGPLLQSTPHNGLLGHLSDIEVRDRSRPIRRHLHGTVSLFRGNATTGANLSRH